MTLSRYMCAFFLSLVFLVWPGDGFSDAQFLFQPPDSSPMVSLPAAHPLRVVRQSAVGIALDVLQGGSARSLVLNLFSDVQLNAEHSNSEYRDEQEYGWYGHVSGVAGSQVILLVKQGQVSGVIHMPQRTFKVWPIDDGWHVVREIHMEEKALTTVSSSAMESADVSPLAQEREVLRLVNDERGQAGLHALLWNDALFNAARDHSLDMATNNYFDHESQDGRSHTQRMTDAGYDGIPFGENIAYGYDTPAKVMVGWMASPGHKENILRASHCDLGVGVAHHDNTNNRLYWTQDFGIRSWDGTCPGVPSNQLPVARFVAQPVSGPAPLRVELDATGSNDPDGQVVGYQWDFGDGTSGNGVTVQHTYTDPGSYTVRLTVVDDGDAIATRTAADLVVVGGAGDSTPDNPPGGENGEGTRNDSSGSGGGCFIEMARISNLLSLRR